MTTTNGESTEEAVRERALAPSLGVTDSEVRIRRNQILDVINARYRGDNREIQQDAIDCEVLWRLARTEIALEALLARVEELENESVKTRVEALEYASDNPVKPQELTEDVRSIEQRVYDLGQESKGFARRQQ